ncbi:MAG: hypothetical protein K2J00_07020 [Bacteroidaceae bacterium]|nr:hypothetical protein [Bacteroidaceae bacterium]
MKTKIFVLALSFMPILSYGQKRSIDNLQNQERETRKNIHNLKGKDKLKAYDILIEIKDSIDRLKTDAIKYLSGFENDARLYLFFTCTDTSVFSSKHIEMDTQKLPKYMQDRYTAISAVRELEQYIKDIECIAQETEANSNIAEARKKERISIDTEKTIDKANELFDKIDELRTSFFSEEQDKFYQELITRFNDFLNKYIFDYEE